MLRYWLRTLRCVWREKFGSLFPPLRTRQATRVLHSLRVRPEAALRPPDTGHPPVAKSSGRVRPVRVEPFVKQYNLRSNHLSRTPEVSGLRGLAEVEAEALGELARFCG